jgi:hypothetical protein
MNNFQPFQKFKIDHCLCTCSRLFSSHEATTQGSGLQQTSETKAR